MRTISLASACPGDQSSRSFGRGGRPRRGALVWGRREKKSGKIELSEIISKSRCCSRRRAGLEKHHAFEEVCLCKKEGASTPMDDKLISSLTHPAVKEGTTGQLPTHAQNSGSAQVRDKIKSQVKAMGRVRPLTITVRHPAHFVSSEGEAKHSTQSLQFAQSSPSPHLPILHPKLTKPAPRAKTHTTTRKKTQRFKHLTHLQK